MFGRKTVADNKMEAGADTKWPNMEVDLCHVTERQDDLIDTRDEIIYMRIFLWYALDYIMGTIFCLFVR